MAFQNCCVLQCLRSSFQQKVPKREPQTLWFTMFPERLFGKWKCWLGVTEFHHFQKWKMRSENILNHNVCGALFGQKCKKGSPRPYDLQCFRNAISHTCFFIPSTMKSSYWEKQKTRFANITIHNVWGSIFSQKCQKRASQTVWFTIFPERDFRKSFFWLGHNEK